MDPAPAPPGSPHQVVPAHAGMDPRSPACCERSRRGPRARGDGPMVKKRGWNLYKWSPRTRGWTPPSRRILTSPCVVPAHAGMDPRRCVGPFRPRRGPRARGDGPSSSSGPCSPTQWSPRVRGWPRTHRHRDPVGCVVPARAGMAPSTTSASSCPICGPRACRDGPRSPFGTRESSQWSPRTRGWSRPLGGQPVSVAMVPANAGMPSQRSWAPAGRGPRRMAAVGQCPADHDGPRRVGPHLPDHQPSRHGYGARIIPP